VIEIEHTAHSPKPRSEVWAQIADIDNWDQWGPWIKTTHEGEIRKLVSDRKRLNGKPYVMTERVTAMEPEGRFEYDLLSGLPIKNYHSVVTLSDADGGGTDIHWSSTFKSPWPGFGWMWRGAMLKVITDVSERLAKA
jgi:Polyketide cyclase / dehydrase and lipid transport